MSITYCTRSTLRETFLAVSGLPAPMVPSEFSSLRTRFEREWPEQQFSSRQYLLPPSPPAGFDPSQDQPPSWFGQIAWDGGRWIGRWGHHTVALHRILLDGEQYQTFELTMRSTLGRWLDAAREAYAYAGLDPAVATVTFGYVNAFDVPGDAADLSEWFRFNFAIEAAGAEDGLSEIAFAASIPRPAHRARATLQVAAERVDDVLRVTVQSVVERDVPEGTRFSDGPTLSTEIDRAKAIAKETFFSFVTERTLEHMGAMHAEPEA